MTKAFMHVKATPCKGRDLEPGDLFSVLGPEYWDYVDDRGSVGECAYIRTNWPADHFPDPDEPVFRLEIVREAPERN